MSLQNKMVALALSATLGLSIPVAALADAVKLQEGTTVRLTLLDTVSSGRNKEGDTVSLKVADDILADDEKTVLIKAGTPAWGTVSLLQEHGLVGQKGEIAFTVQGTKSIDGKKVPLRANLDRQGTSKLGTTVALSLIVSPLFLLMKGKDAKIPAGASVTAYVDKDVLVEAKVEGTTNISTAVSSATSAPATPVDAAGNTESKSMPNYLQKYVDGGAQASQLKALEQLYSQGVLTQAEFEAKKKLLVEKK
jgi:hypothetical protein